MRVYKQVSTHIVDYDDDNGGLPITESIKKLVFMPDHFDEEKYMDWVASQNDDCESMTADYIGNIDILDVMYEHEDGCVMHKTTIINLLDQVKEFKVIT